MTRLRTACLIVLLGVTSMGAIDADAVTVSELAEAGDVDRLGEVTSVNGIPVDMERMLDGESVDRRTDTLERLFSPGDVLPFTTRIDPEAARTVASEVLEQSKFDVPTESAFDRFLAQAQAWLAEALFRLVSALGGARNAGLIALVIVALAGLAGFAFLARRRTATIERTTNLERILAEGGNPDEYERLAALADREGRFSDSIRYRFVAGLLRLDLAGRITFRPGLTTGQVVDDLGDERFARLARQFEDVAYGGREATEEMRDRSIEEWRTILGERVPA